MSVCLRPKQPIQQASDLLLKCLRDQPNPTVPLPHKRVLFCVPTQTDRRHRKKFELASLLQVFNQIEFIAIPSDEEGAEELDILSRTSKEQGVLALEI